VQTCFDRSIVHGEPSFRLRRIIQASISDLNRLSLFSIDSSRLEGYILERSSAAVGAKTGVFMRHCLRSSILVAESVLAFAALALAQTPPRNPPDLSGVWDRPGAAREAPAGPEATAVNARRQRVLPRQAFSFDEPPMHPWAVEKYRQAREDVEDIYESGKDEIDPTYNCFPPGMPRIFTGIRPFEIHQLPKVVLMLFESDHWVRRIHTDGRGHPEGYPVTFMGHSVGKWEGDTLVVDTVNIDSRSWLDGLGHPMSEALRVEERIRRPGRDTLEIDFVFNDPKTYTRPWTGKKTFQLMPTGYEVMEDVVCVEYLEIGKRRQIE
jgi:hypothetical protein